jgi:voltage-gated potassium channel
VASRPRVDRFVDTFHEGPASVRNAIRLIVGATIVTTVVGGLLVWVFDRHDFHNLGTAMWWALQTVTTVGYGDVTPKNGIGRIIGACVLLYSVAFLTILTAAITTSFIERARGERKSGATEDAVVSRLDDIAARLDRLERRLGGDAGS